jgi:uncharacterized protein
MTRQADAIHDFDPQTHSGAMPSPCIGICRMDAGSGLCEGCFRTMDEIAYWRTATEDVKRTVWMEIKRRHAAVR